MHILSWNVNGLRASYKKGFLSWLYDENADMVCIQETKAEEKDLPRELKNPEGYFSYFTHSKNKKGYSGVCVYTKIEPKKVEYGIGIKKFDDEGRVIVLYFIDFIIVNAYFPNSGMDGRLSYKIEFNDTFLKLVNRLIKTNKNIIFCGDLNVAHEDIDIARPKENIGSAGFTEEERAWIDEVLQAGFIDTYRHIYPDKTNKYTWWDMKSRARDRNVGWRIDYFFISNKLVKNLRNSYIFNDIYGSDHCPVGIEIDL